MTWTLHKPGSSNLHTGPFNNLKLRPETLTQHKNLCKMSLYKVKCPLRNCGSVVWALNVALCTFVKKIVCKYYDLEFEEWDNTVSISHHAEATEAGTNEKKKIWKTYLFVDRNSNNECIRCPFFNQGFFMGSSVIIKLIVNFIYRGSLVAQSN